MIRQPAHISGGMYEQALEQLRQKHNGVSVAQSRFESFHEGLSVQVMHVGPYADEPPTIEKLQAFAPDSGYQLRGKHHEIDSGDPRRAGPENLKTILRRPVQPVAD
ncbi:MAG: GyrI-like domain-containing protein [Candidatus Promineifilaceae bacterium]|nr:GyrI-like domain-containing protein [Candidatus Promineifilaceae bacterium]